MLLSGHGFRQKWDVKVFQLFDCLLLVSRDSPHFDLTCKTFLSLQSIFLISGLSVFSYLNEILISPHAAQVRSLLPPSPRYFIIYVHSASQFNIFHSSKLLFKSLAATLNFKLLLPLPYGKYHLKCQKSKKQEIFENFFLGNRRYMASFNFVCNYSMESNTKYDIMLISKYILVDKKIRKHEFFSSKNNRVITMSVTKNVRVCMNERHSHLLRINLNISIDVNRSI